jgi:AcrR family transcriptional regulator
VASGETHTSEPSRQRRSDARRNVDRIVAAAGVAFRRDGPNVPLDRIAEEAGIGSATLHRHFSGRRALLLAVCKVTIDELAHHATTLHDEPGAEDPLWRWLDYLVRHCAQDAALAAALHADGTPPEQATSWSPLTSAGAPLLADAIVSGHAHPDVDITALLVLVDAIATSCPDRPDDASRFLAIVRAGIEAPPTEL